MGTQVGHVAVMQVLPQLIGRWEGERRLYPGAAPAAFIRIERAAPQWTFAGVAESIRCSDFPGLVLDPRHYHDLFFFLS